MKSVIKISLLLLTVLHTLSYVKTQDEATETTEDSYTTEDAADVTTMEVEIPPEDVPYKITEIDGVKTLSYIYAEQIVAPTIKDFESISSMILDDNSFIELSDLTFPQVLVNLKTLSVRNNVVSTISKTIFDRLPNLETLDLSDNHINKLTDDLTASNTLTELILDNNAPKLTIYQIPKMPKLKKLVLSNCKLTKLRKDVFENVPNLEELDLNSNDISNDTVTIESFKGLSHLNKLILPESAAKDEFIDAVCKANRNLKDICIEICDEANRVCVIKDDEVTTSVDIGESTIIPEIVAEDPEIKKTAYSMDSVDDPIVKNLGKKHAMKIEDAPENSVPATSRTGVTTNGVNWSTIGAVFGVFVVVIVGGVLIRRNWTTIKGKFGSSEENSASAPNARKERLSEKSPEEVPLQIKNEQNPV